jgi:superfamily II DNA or RNA helicase
MIIVDECHHVSAFSFEKVLATANAKYVYGLTATPIRKDGRHPIMFMQCGPIRFRDDAKKQAEKRPFEHYIIPRFTTLRTPITNEEQDISITDLYTAIVENEHRNQLIIEDILRCHEMGRNCLVLTERTAHVDLLAKELGKNIPDVIVATGGRGVREAGEILASIVNAPTDRPLTLVATGRYIGEGFDEPRLDTLFFAMPISWKGTLQQYAGRLHRMCEGKNEVQIYDYVDIHVRMLQKMYYRRLNGYAAIGYKAKSENLATEDIDFIYDKHSFLPVLINDVVNSAREIVIVSPFLNRKRTNQMIAALETAIKNNVNVVIVTRQIEDFREKERHEVIQTLAMLKTIGVGIIDKSMLHQKYAVIDQGIVWYGSINLLSYGNAEESIMRLENHSIANELLREL